MIFARSGGILLHPTSLPGPYGIGDIGPAAREFVDWLVEAGCGLWQILPLSPTGYGNSPYQCFSAFAGNPYLISPDSLLHDGLLTQQEVHAAREADGAAVGSRIDFATAIPRKLALLAHAFQRFEANDPREYREALALFRAEHAEWLEDYALFMALKEAHGGGSWMEWPAPLRLRQPEAMAGARRDLARSILRHSFYQLLFYRQWSALRAHANRSGVRIIGDVPIFVAEDSSDVWAHPDLFQLDDDRRPTVVGGVPPDYFSPTGQLWGNPLYRWEVHRETGYSWWLSRLRATLATVDIVRLDHFRGFAACWEIPAGNPTAEIGRWAAGPGLDLFDAVARGLEHVSGNGSPPMIAEDLGVITSDVLELRDRYHLPGMKVLQFGFTGSDNPFLPHNYSANCVAYTGTHDNDTARGWLSGAPKQEARFAKRYLHSNTRRFAWDMIRAAWSSVAVFSLAPMQDVLELGPEARMNYPSRAEGNWEWRLREGELKPTHAAHLHELKELFGR